jgi:DNA-binding NarL/FixJ family response regulator
MNLKDCALVVDDHPLVARGFAAFLQTHCSFAAVHVVASVSECVRWVSANGCPRLVVVDFWLADGAALSLLGQLSLNCRVTRLLVVSGDDTPGIQTRVHESGAHGFVRKSEAPDIFAHAVMTLARGENWFPNEDRMPLLNTSRRELPLRADDLGLTGRQMQVLKMMLRGLPNKRIAYELSVSESTIKEHVTGILAKLGASSRVELITRLHGKRYDV